MKAFNLNHSAKPHYGPIIALASIFGLRMLGLFMILPVFTLYTQQFEAITPFQIGLALGIYGLTQAIFQLPFGILSDSLGRKPMITLGLGLFVLGSAIAALSHSIFGVILGRFLQGSGAIGSVIMALAADLSDKSWRAQAMAMIGITIGIAFALAFILGPIVTDLLQGIKGLFWLTSVLGMLCIGILALFVPTLKPEKFNKIPISSLLMTLIKNKKIIVLNLGVLVIHLSLTALFLKIPKLIESLGYVHGTSWKVYCPVLGISMGLGILILHYLDKLSYKPSIYTKILLLSVISVLAGSEILLWSFYDNTLIFCIALTLFFTAFTVLEAGLPAQITHCVTENLRGTTMGFYATLQFFGLFLGGLLGGLLDSYSGLNAVVALCFIVALIWFIICWLLF